MKKVLKVIGILVLLLVAFVLIAAIFVPKKAHLERSISINAAPEKIWPLVSSFKNHTKWSPFIDKDPDVKITYEGTDATVNSSYAWDGDDNVGSGKQTMTAMQQPTSVKTHLHFIRPFESDAEAFIDVVPSGNVTKVTWGFDSEYSYPMNAMMLFFDLDKNLGPSYVEGLEKLKKLAEQ